MFQPCPVCGWEDTVNDSGRLPVAVCECSECGSRFRIDTDAEVVGEDWVDCSSVGRQLSGPTRKYEEAPR